MTTLPVLVDRGAPIDEIAAFLDGLEHPDRVLACESLAAGQLRKLYERAASSRPLTRADLVPDGIGARDPVYHHGWNSLPVPTFARRFGKPMCGMAGTDELGGWNHNTVWVNRLVGPGFFVCRATESEHVDRGAWVVDYLRVPTERVAAGWPPVVSTSFGFRPQRLVYGGTRDYLRRVSEHVSIGIPYKGAIRLPFAFTLVRAPRRT
jgi:hypothetical protein